jgi:hypothetical protein
MAAEEREVLAANAAFYEAFAERDMEGMDALWSPRDDVACVHPGWEGISGRSGVMTSWRSPRGPWRRRSRTQGGCIFSATSRS